MKKMKNFKYTFVVVLLATFVSCGYEPEIDRVGERSQLSTSDVLDARGYSILLEAVTHAGLDNVLQGTDSITVLAPNNAAFEVLLSDLGVASITDVPVETVSAILSYHIAGVPAFSTGLPRSVPALDGNTLYFSTATGVSVNGKATVVEPDMVSNVAVIHGINKVLDVPVGNLFLEMQANDSLSMLVSAIEAAGITSLFTGQDEYTIFAPTNSAFDGVDIASLTAEQLTEILGFHVLANVNFSQELPVSGRLATIQGNSADDEVQEIVKEEAFLNDAELIALNAVANNGVIHTVSAIIEKQITVSDVFGPLNPSTFDAFGVDQFGTIITGLDYPLSLTDTLSYYTPLFGSVYADFTSDEEATDYVENHIFSGITNIWTLDNGTKISSINDSEYYVATGNFDGTTVALVNGSVANAFTSGGIPTSGIVGQYYFSLVALPEAEFVPLPEENIVEVLSAEADYSLFVALVEKLELVNTLTTGDYTVLPVADSVFAAGTAGLNGGVALSSLEAIDTLNAEEDGDLLEALEEIASNHVVAGANFSVHIATFFPSLETLGETILEFAIVLDEDTEVLRIILDPTDPNNENVGLVAADILANNGVIHEVNSFIIF